MKPRSTLIPVLLAAVLCLGLGNASRAEPAARAAPIGVPSGATERLTAPVALGADERAELQRASEASPGLEGLRGGQLSDHDLSVALLVVGVVIIVLLI